MSSREEIIEQLQEKASDVLELKKQHRLKRPIVIEFSGSPKSGKTSCINSLELFLKRNGFIVRTVQERASVCPVTDKLSPMFNIWTACTSLAGMIGTLEDKKDNNQIDVLILDRGVFDSLCWFDWLVKKGRMENEQRKIMENFLLMGEIVKPVDIVFAFTVDPEESIKREYTHLLTDKTGTIMNLEVLEEYKNSVMEMAENKKGHFHKIFHIDTTNENQDEVGRNVTDMTLQALSELLMEKIGFFRRNNGLNELALKKTVFEYDEVKDIFPEIEFDLRKNVEDDRSLLQPIPVVVICNKTKDKVLVIRKSKEAVSKASPEKDKLLVYVGGHMRYEDMTEVTSKDFLDICRSTLKREVKEELGISVALSDLIPFIIYTGENGRSFQHMAICFRIELEESIRLRLDAKELIQKKGTSKSGKFIALEELKTTEGEFENWSKLILNKCFGTEFNIEYQMGMNI